MAPRYPVRRDGTVPRMSELVCPKCESPMRSYERSGITVDQCTGCRGVFLDRGELERLVDAENAWHAGPPAPATPPPGRSAGGLGAVVEQVVREAKGSRSYGTSQHGYRHAPYGKRKKSFLSELFD